MKAVVFHGVGDIRLDEVKEPRIERGTDAIVRLTASAICGTDLHMVRGTMPGMKKGTILGHEGVGIIEELGDEVRNLAVGDRVVIPSTIACGACPLCVEGHYAQCDGANPHGMLAGTAFFGGPEMSGPFHGLQAELARVPFASVGLVKLPDEVTDDQAIALSDIFPTGYFGAVLAGVGPGKVVAVLGCGPVGQFAIASARLLGAERVIAVDTIPSRLAMAAGQGAEVIDFNAQDPVEVIRELTGGRGADCVIEAVGVDAMHPEKGPAASQARKHRKVHKAEIREVAPVTHPHGDNWHPGDAPSLALRWAVEAVAKAGTLGIVGVYPQTADFFPIGAALNKNLVLRMGNCDHRKYIPELLQMVQSKVIDPSRIITQDEPLASAIEAYEAFDTRAPGWIKVKLEPTKIAA